MYPYYEHLIPLLCIPLHLIMSFYFFTVYDISQVSLWLFLIASLLLIFFKLNCCFMLQQEQQEYIFESHLIVYFQELK